ncbi:hypothetical protein [Bradyrhizobium stylosanthis]|uniref:hypothetical protein n=1 Tax=Bradyrhizobium stylosanthis TaxID=1803665 RepID=UPI0011A5B760|nr:hypothetical protein [Bradyrhizobium stylosanthis]
MQLHAFDLIAIGGEDLRQLPLEMRKTNLARLLRGRPEGMFIAPLESGATGPDLFRAASDLRLECIVSSAATAAISPAARVNGSRSRTTPIRP